eukprot:4848380-Lingulodinium_polyedra.AAC.1
MLDALPRSLGPPIHRGRAVITRGRQPADPPDAARCGTSGLAEAPRTLRAKFAVANVLTLGRESVPDEAGPRMPSLRVHE